MASENDPGRPGGSEAERPSELAGLEERVGHLELELAALKRRIDGERATQAAAAGVAPPVRTTAPPPPPPTGVVSGSTQATRPGAQRSVFEAWPSASSRPAAVPISDSRDSLENQLGSRVFSWIAIALLLIGTAYFLKLAVDRGWIVPSPTGRVIAGLIAGAALVLWSERFRRKGFAAFSYSLKAVGSGVLYLTMWAAFQRFHLIDPAVALALMLLVTAWNAYMAWVQDSELLAAYALAGGFATPLLLSTGGNQESFLFLYLLAIDLAMVALVRLRAWPRLLLGAFPLTVAFFIGWYVEFYQASELTATAIYIALFAVAFASVPLRRQVEIESSERGTGRQAQASAARGAQFSTLVEDILLPLANAAFAALAFYSVLQDSGHHEWLPWLMIMLAAAYLGLMRAPQTAVASAIHLSLAVVFLTIAIPLKASGHWITVSWLVEGLALLWVATRLAGAKAVDEGSRTGSAHASRSLRWLALVSLLLGFCGICVHLVALSGMAQISLLNDGVGTALVGIAVFAGVAWLALRAGSDSQAGVEAGTSGRTPVWSRTAMDAFILIVLTAAFLTTRELLASWSWSGAHPPFQTADFFTALIALAVFAGVIAVSARIAAERSGEAFWKNCAALSTIAFNLIAVLTGVREIEAIWEGSAPSPDAGLQQALAISGFLMLYGAALLAVGFWKRSSFLRWQALVLLVFTIFKTFLHDLRNLGEGYGVASVLGLGALLMAISFAYQKDWLNLRGEKRSAGANEGAR